MALSIAIKPGSTFTSIYVSGHGLVLKEPTLAAFDINDKKRIRAVGYEALAMRGKAHNVTVVSPVNEGVITEPEIFSLMLREYLNKLSSEEAIFRPRYKAIVGIPLGLSIAEREMYEETFLEAGVHSITLVPSIILSAIGADLPVSTGKGMLAINIGGGRTELALISYGGIINGCGVGIGGLSLDKALVDHVMRKYNAKITLDEATKIREEIGSLYDNDIASRTVSGMDIMSKVPEFVSVGAYDVREVVLPYFIRICDLAKTIVRSCPASIAHDIMSGGVAITGGVSNIPGIDALFAERIQLPIKAFQRPEYLQIVGAGKLLANDELLYQLIDGGAV
ncbi:MAG: rod shape-determining protein [Clostridiales bacterium]|nr:rod shape-determining protein [Clostridiales bacterium]